MDDLLVAVVCLAFLQLGCCNEAADRCASLNGRCEDTRSCDCAYGRWRNGIKCNPDNDNYRCCEPRAKTNPNNWDPCPESACDKCGGRCSSSCEDTEYHLVEDSMNYCDKEGDVCCISIGERPCYRVNGVCLSHFCHLPKHVEDCNVAGTLYDGPMNITMHGYMCLGSPCRNPDYTMWGEWCNTKPDAYGWDWDHCEVPLCNDCSLTGPDPRYKSRLTVTWDGRECRRWDEMGLYSSEDFPHDANISEAANFCRDPDRGLKKGSPWCHTWIFDSDRWYKWGYCDVPPICDP